MGATPFDAQKNPSESSRRDFCIWHQEKIKPNILGVDNPVPLAQPWEDLFIL